MNGDGELAMRLAETFLEGALAEQIAAALVEVIVFPPALYVAAVHSALRIIQTARH